MEFAQVPRMHLQLSLTRCSLLWLIGLFLRQLRSPVQNHRKRLRWCFGRVEQESLAVRRGIPAENMQGRVTVYARYRKLKQGFRGACLEYRSLRDVHSHESSAERKIEQLLTVTSPAWLVTPIARNLSLASSTQRRGEWLNIYFDPAGLIRSIGDPVGVGRELPVALVELGIGKWPRLTRRYSVSPQWQNP